MGSPYLNTNETIILSTHNIIINTIPAEAILTNQRLILVDSRHTRLQPQDVPFTALETVTIGDTSAMDPVLSLSVVMKDETRHTFGIVFPQEPKTKRTLERDEWATKLKEASVNAQQEHGVQPAELLPPWVAGEIPEEAGDEGKAQGLEDEKYYNPPLSPRKPRAAPSSNKHTIIAAGVVVVLIIAIAIGVYFFAPSLIGIGSPAVTPSATPVATPVLTPVVTATATQTSVPTEQPTAIITEQPVVTPTVTVMETSVSQSGIPQTGVWIRIEYEGNFTASFGTSGRLREITGSGVLVYQIPAKDEIVEATVEKLDDFGGILTVTIYNEGQIAESGTTQKPHGIVEIHTDLRTP
ncbi:MAG: hypothetical protein M0R30_02850 [Methanoregula sp.]|jgi:hypothetical protein|uniref:hypothetical protein n=1 Tax=Methanoregula sp. TaxID=2052170 RepID=UPI0025CCF448|nr:hypothetical protein [Methanoregula sp.]MCK9630558.1 hypothetical protein [Methanoregula sp.]